MTITQIHIPSPSGRLYPRYLAIEKSAGIFVSRVGYYRWHAIERVLTEVYRGW